MVLDPSTSLETAKEAAQTAKGTKAALDDMKKKVGVMSDVGEELKKLASEFKTLSPQERLKRVGGIIALAVLGFVLDDEDQKRIKEGEADEKEVEKDEKKAKKEQDAAEEEAREDPDFDESEEVIPDVVRGKKSLVNMYAIRYYEKDGSKHSNPNKIAKILIRENITPSKFILEKSRALFREGVGTYESFKENVTSKLVPENVKGDKERVRQAALILACCAVGRYQIVPYYHFKKMDWPVEGEEGLKALYNFIRSEKKQSELYKAILKPMMKRFHNDAGLVAVNYYSDQGQAYEKDPNNSKWKTKQFGGHASIEDYAAKARRYYAEFQAQGGATPLDYMQWTLEKIESGGSFGYEQYLAAKGKYRTEKATDRGPKPGKPSGYDKIKGGVKPAVEAKATQILGKLKGQNWGARETFTINGEEYVGQLEEHYHEPGGPQKPWGYHDGITVYKKSA